MNKNSSLDRLVSFAPLVLAAGLLLNSCASTTAEKPAAPPPPAEAAKAEAAPAEAPKAEAIAPEAPKPAAQAEAQETKPEPPKPEAPKPPPAAVAGSSTQLFDFDKAILRPSERARLDNEVVARLATFADVEYVNVNGHADRIGTARYNQKLSERRAAAAKAYLISRGVDGSKIATHGFGETMQVKGCPDIKNRKALIACLEPNRRVVVDIKGTPRQ